MRYNHLLENFEKNRYVNKEELYSTYPNFTLNLVHYGNNILKTKIYSDTELALLFGFYIYCEEPDKRNIPSLMDEKENIVICTLMEILNLEYRNLSSDFIDTLKKFIDLEEDIY